MYYYLYEIRNILNGKIYVGVHKTKDLEDGYMGSGKVILLALAKHGRENFTKVILEFFENAETMYAREAEVVNEAFLKREDVYNLRRGGFGGFDYINEHRDHSLHNLKISLNRDYSSEEYREKLRQATLDSYENGRPKVGFKSKEIQQMGNSPEARQKAVKTVKETFKIMKHAQGERNSQFGTMWITNHSENRKIKKNEPLPEGWVKGRIQSRR